MMIFVRSSLKPNRQLTETSFFFFFKQLHKLKVFFNFNKQAKKGAKICKVCGRKKFAKNDNPHVIYTDDASYE